MSDLGKQLRRLTKLDIPKIECELCGSQRKVQRHHIFKVEWLKSIARAIGLDQLANMLPDIAPQNDLCEPHHDKLHEAMGERPKTGTITSNEYDYFKDLYSDDRIPDQVIMTEADWAVYYVEKWQDTRAEIAHNQELQYGEEEEL